MAEQEPKAENAPEDKAARGKDEVALELMKFIAVSTGYAKPAQSGGRFLGKGRGPLARRASGGAPRPVRALPAGGEEGRLVPPSRPAV